MTKPTIVDILSQRLMQAPLPWQRSESHSHLTLGSQPPFTKAQGRTIHQIVIDLTWHPISALRMQYASALVALTRVKRKCDLRRVCHDPRRDKADHDYLTKLQPPMCLQSYHAGYQTNPNPNEGSTWSPTKALAKQEALLKAKISKS